MGHLNFIHSGTKTTENYFGNPAEPLQLKDHNRSGTHKNGSRRSRMNYFLTLILGLFTLVCFAQNTPPQIQITDVTADETAKTLTVNYSLSDAESDLCEVWLKMSIDDGIYYETIPQSNISGDIGTGINPNPTLSLTWDYSDLTVGIRTADIKLYASDNQAVDIAEMVSQVDESRLLSDLQSIEGERQYLSTPVHLEEVRTYVEDAFTDGNLQTERQDFVVAGTGGTIMQNILGRQPGAKDEAITYIINGHLDTEINTPGADEDGSGIAGTLEALRILSQYSFEHSIRFINFDAAALGSQGGYKYVSNGIKPFENIQGALNMEMLGFYSDDINSQTIPVGFEILFPDAVQQMADEEFRGNFIFGVGNTDSDPLLTSFIDATENYVPELRLITVSVEDVGQSAPDLRRGDHAAFWDAELKALMLTDTAEFRNYNWNTPGDSIATLDFDFMKNVVKANLATIAVLAKPISAGFDETDLITWLSVDDHNPLVPAKMFIFPNPSNGLLSLRIENAKSSFTSQVEVYDLIGKRVFQNVLEFSAGTSNSEMNLQLLAKGSYILKLKSENFTKSIGFIISD